MPEFLRCLIGAPLGLAISTIITIGTSFAIGDGSFYAVVPELIRDCGSEVWREKARQDGVPRS